MAVSALLVLADGTVFKGTSIGAQGCSVGEVVFNTSMTGYQEILTDPSYAEQIVTLTYPHIGNTGTNYEDLESDCIRAKGLVIRDLPLIASNFRSKQTLSEYLKIHKLIGIADIDTRKLTKLLREKGAQNGCIITVDDKTENLDELIKYGLTQANDFAGLKGLDLAKEVSCESISVWNHGLWKLGNGHDGNVKDFKYHVVAYDFGVKKNILRILVDRGCKVTLVPATTSAEEVMALNPDGVFLSNGPGDPEPCTYAIKAITEFFEKKVPLFGICLGHQLLALAAGAKTEKMKFGHHGANHPVKDLKSGKVLITSQNHGFTVTDDKLPENIKVTHISLFDNSIQGIELEDCPAFSFQGHPEASPGPHEAADLFDHFISHIENAKQ